MSFDEWYAVNEQRFYENHMNTYEVAQAAWWGAYRRCVEIARDARFRGPYADDGGECYLRIPKWSRDAIVEALERDFE